MLRVENVQELFSHFRIHNTYYHDYYSNNDCKQSKNDYFYTPKLIRLTVISESLSQELRQEDP